MSSSTTNYPREASTHVNVVCYLSQQAPADSFIDCTAFEVLGLQQPFSVSVSSNVHLLMVTGVCSDSVHVCILSSS